MLLWPSAAVTWSSYDLYPDTTQVRSEMVSKDKVDKEHFVREKMKEKDQVKDEAPSDDLKFSTAIGKGCQQRGGRNGGRQSPVCTMNLILLCQ